MLAAMVLIRRSLAAFVAAALTAAPGTQAQDFPDRPIRLVVGFTAAAPPISSRGSSPNDCVACSERA